MTVLAVKPVLQVEHPLPFLKVSPYRILPRLASNTLFAEEPSCQNATRDDGKIQFEVVGGDLPQGGQYPYEIIWEKFDVGSGSYLELDGTNGTQNLFMQSLL